MLFYFIVVSGMLVSLQYRCQKIQEDSERPTFEELEKLFEIENRMLDMEISMLLNEHRCLTSGEEALPDEYYVSSDLEERFAALERRIKNGGIQDV